MTELVVWNPPNLGSLSADKLTATIIGASSLTNATVGKSGTKKYYWEITFTSGRVFLVGISNANLTKRVEYRSHSGYVRYTNSTSYSDKAYGKSSGVGSVYGILTDLENKTLEFYIDGVSQGVLYNPNGIFDSEIYPSVSGNSGGETISITANFGASKFVYDDLFKELTLDGYMSYDENQGMFFLIKQNNQYYSIKPDFYSKELMQYKPLDELDFSKGFNLDELFDVVTIGNENPIDITPIMTSNTTPSPYVVSASSQYDANYLPWKAFNGTNIVGYHDCWAVNSKSGWIQLDYGEGKKINGISVTAANRSEVASAPKDFLLQGSNDGIKFDTIESIMGQTNWKQNETRIFGLGRNVLYRYYRIIINSNNGLSWSAIGKINFFQGVYNSSMTKITAVR